MLFAHRLLRHINSTVATSVTINIFLFVFSYPNDNIIYVKSLWTSMYYMHTSNNIIIALAPNKVNRKHQWQMYIIIN